MYPIEEGGIASPPVEYSSSSLFLTPPFQTKRRVIHNMIRIAKGVCISAVERQQSINMARYSYI